MQKIKHITYYQVQNIKHITLPGAKDKAYQTLPYQVQNIKHITLPGAKDKANHTLPGAKVYHTLPGAKDKAYHTLPGAKFITHCQVQEIKPASTIILDQFSLAGGGLQCFFCKKK